MKQIDIAHLFFFNYNIQSHILLSVKTLKYAIAKFSILIQYYPEQDKKILYPLGEVPREHLP